MTHLGEMALEAAARVKADLLKELGLDANSSVAHADGRKMLLWQVELEDTASIVRAYLSALPSSPVSELVGALIEWSKPDTGSHDAGVQLVCEQAASTLTTLSTRNAELEREVKRLRGALEAVDGLIPTDVITSILSIGRVEWGATEKKSSEDHLLDLDNTLRMTREYFDLEDVPVAMHGVYIEGSEVVVCHTGTSPNSPQHARILTGAWNRLHELALALSTSPQGGEHE